MTMRDAIPLVAAALALACSGCIGGLDGTYSGWVATARFAEPLDTSTAVAAGERLGWEPETGLGDDGAGVGFNVSDRHGLRYGTGSSVGQGRGDRILEATFRADAERGEGHPEADRTTWQASFEAWLETFERETGWGADGVTWTKTSTH